MKPDASTPTFSATKLAAIVKKHAPAQIAAPAADPVATLVHAFLLWEASTQHAASAMERIAKESVDFNELRVCLPEEIITILGGRYPYVEERSSRLRRVLNDLYRREHKVSIEHISASGKRDQRNYIENLDGMLPFVSSRVLLLHFGQPTVPVDDQLVDLLRDAKVLQREDLPAADLAGALSKSATSTDDATRMHLALVGFADSVWSEDPKSISKAKQLRTAAQRAIEAKAAKLKLEAAKAEAAKAEAIRVAEEKAAAAKKGSKPDSKGGKSSDKIAAQSAKSAKSIEAKPTANGGKSNGKPIVKGTGKSAAKPLLKPAAKAAAKAQPKLAARPVPPHAKVVKIVKPLPKSAKKARK